MRRLSKVGLLSLLLILPGMQGFASMLCVQPVKTHGHACCGLHEQINAPHSVTPSAQTQDLSCCKVAPIDSAPVENPLLSSGTDGNTPAIRATSALTGNLTSVVLLVGRASTRSEKLQHSPRYALLCTFLV